MNKYFYVLLFLFFNIILYSQGVSNTLLEAGISDYNKGQYTFAINNLRKFIQIVEDNQEKPKAFYYLSLSYYFIENYNQALNYINELQTKFKFSSYSTQAQFWRGLINQNKKEWQEAEEAFLKYIASDPNSELIERAYLATANSQLEQGKLLEAEKNLQVIVDKYKKSDKYEEASVLYAYLLIKNGKQNEANKFLSYWINKLGKSGEGFIYRDRFWLYLAQIEIDKKNWDNARILLKKVDTFSKNTPSSDIALLQLSKIEENEGNFKESKEYLLRLANEYPSSKYNTDAIVSFAKEEFRNNNFTDSLVLFKQALTISENQLKDKNIKGEDKERLKELTNTSLFYIAEIYMQTNSITNAIENYKLITNLKGILYEESLLKLLEIYTQKNRLNEAIIIISTNDSDLINSNYKDRYLLLKSKILYLNGKFNDSLKILNDIKDKNSNIVNITNLKVNNYIKLNNYNEAIKTLNDAVVFYPHNE
ncbi:MAG TPA: tetratricopeptide repeat protein, partial [Spirochaetota bacterium]|nr:tetratricopeptide repeat protein [Spirochaetota bacterium]